MKRISLFLFLFICSALATSAAEFLSITGVVSDAQGKPLVAATVFIDGSKKITATNELGQFRFTELNPGTYKVVVNMVGYHSVKQTVNLEKTSKALMITLKVKEFALKEVVIKSNSERAAFLELFISNFLGNTENAVACEILNTEILDFVNDKKTGLLEATSDDFLIIINKNLGFRIKYLLRAFRYNRQTRVASYDGEVIFEQLEGSASAETQWLVNRKKAYLGSLMHYLRTVYHNNSREEGFITYDQNGVGLKLKYVEEVVSRIDSNFVSLHYINPIYVRYDKENALKAYQPIGQRPAKSIVTGGSTLKLYLSEAVLDEKGSYVDYKSFFIQGYWGSRRIGDQLPFEYILPD
ncbi:carboxypeptidase-like regulatory domain-containing protein [Pedobacter sp. GR22-6]|uniref:carboxypeptidase-like regulatory domain-containing protein n=1 Tax=Pedobacter sp. GR22-6 TaxID=3127957 RepID=UPI00307EBEAF